uniref:Uncharacterized protein n=1 Tax=Trypanosoma congolense (strain IL3000) TaxID=1068625 RepID=G0UZK5_TRYCI|nr:hypothetical protein, unlikely [Trypanosoma congolense IL3000]
MFISSDLYFSSFISTISFCLYDSRRTCVSPLFSLFLLSSLSPPSFCLFSCLCLSVRLHAAAVVIATSDLLYWCTRRQCAALSCCSHSILGVAWRAHLIGTKDLRAPAAI